MKKLTFLVWGLLILLFACQDASHSDSANWAAYQGNKRSNQYSGLTQIDTTNVHQLKVAWVHHTEDADTIKNRTQIQCNPLIIDGILYGSSAQLKFFALNAATGERLWLFDPFAEKGFQSFGMGVNRGLAYWTDGKEQRLLVTAGSYLYALDATTGKPFDDFGANGKVDLHNGLDRDVAGFFINSNTPGIVYQDKLILGCRVSESGRDGAVPGHIRAFNVKTGEQEWIFHTIPHPGEYGYDTWPADAWKHSGGANTWAGFSLDEARGIVYAPTGSASFDFYGGDRIGENLFANCLLALDANTGERLWHFQAVHHDLWDRDLPAPPNLITVERDGKKIDAVAQMTKSALIFVFDRVTGEPLFDIEEMPVPASELVGEVAWSTQPVPVKPAPFARSVMDSSDITRRTPEAYAYVKARWDTLKKGNPFMPPSLQGSLLFPGFDGGGEWGGAAFDPTTGNFIVNASEIPVITQMVPAADKTMPIGQQLYTMNCIACHGKALEGSDAFGGVPSLVGLKERMNTKAIATLISNGKGAMPSFAHLSKEKVDAITNFLLGQVEVQKKEVLEESNWTYPYYFKGYQKFTDQEGYPSITPPWGTLNAINLNTGEAAWKVTLGEYPELIAQGLPPTGSQSYGGPVVTAGGLVFMAGTMDDKIRAFHKDTGALLWEAKLPAAGFATPAVYAVAGKQYVVIACGGGKLGKKSGDAYVAFGL